MAKQKLGSIKYQINQRFKELNRIGHSKHQAKKDYRQKCKQAKVKWNPAKADGIYSNKTMDAYKQSAYEFGAWLKDNTDIRDISHVTRDHVVAYLQQRQDEGKSAYTLSKDMSALNKTFSMSLTKKDAGIKERSYKNSTRSRMDREHDKKYNPKNYERQITVAQAFGLRRQSIYGGQYQLKEVSLFRSSQDGKLYAAVIEKGGRYREAPCLNSMQPTIEKLFPQIQERDPLGKDGKAQFQQLYQSSQTYLFDKYTTKIDNHAFRHQYARELYQELYNQGIHLQVKDGEKLYRGYNEYILREVSQALGHNRPSVVVEHYLR